MFFLFSSTWCCNRDLKFLTANGLGTHDFGNEVRMLQRDVNIRVVVVQIDPSNRRSGNVALACKGAYDILRAYLLVFTKRYPESYHSRFSTAVLNSTRSNVLRDRGG